MPCYYVLVHGALKWSGPPESVDAYRPRGFFCHRHVLAANEQRAAETAFAKVRRNIDRQTGWLSTGSAVLTLEAEEVRRAPFRKLLWPANQGHTFYARD